MKHSKKIKKNIIVKRTKFRKGGDDDSWMISLYNSAFDNTLKKWFPALLTTDYDKTLSAFYPEEYKSNMLGLPTLEYISELKNYMLKFFSMSFAAGKEMVIILSVLYIFGRFFPYIISGLYKTGKGVVKTTGYVFSNTIWNWLNKKINSIGEYFNSFRFIYEIFSMQSMKSLQKMLGYFNKGEYFKLLFMIKDMPLDQIRRIIQNLTMTDMDKLFKSVTETLCNFDRGNCNDKQEIRNELLQLIEKSELIKPFIERLYQGIANYHESHNEKWIEANNNLDWTCLEIGKEVFQDEIAPTLLPSYTNIISLFFSFLKMIFTILYWITRYLYYQFNNKRTNPVVDIEKDEKIVQQLNVDMHIIDGEKLTLIHKYYKTGEYIKILKLLNKKDIKKLITEQTNQFTDHRIYTLLNNILSDMLTADRTIKKRSDGIRIFRCVLETFLHSNDIVNTLFRKLTEYKEYLKSQQPQPQPLPQPPPQPQIPIEQIPQPLPARNNNRRSRSRAPSRNPRR